MEEFGGCLLLLLLFGVVYTLIKYGLLAAAGVLFNVLVFLPVYIFDLIVFWGKDDVLSSVPRLGYDQWEFWVCLLIGVVVGVVSGIISAAIDNGYGGLAKVNGIIGLYFGVWHSLHIVGTHAYRVVPDWIGARRVASVERKAAESRAKEARAKERQQMEKLKDFALAESPGIWQSYQEMAGEIEDRERRLGELERILADFGRNPEYDARFRQLRADIAEMNGIRSRIVSKLEEAYLAKAKFDATIGAQEAGELRSKVWNDGIREAEEAASRFREMRDNK